MCNNGCKIVVVVVVTGSSSSSSSSSSTLAWCAITLTYIS